MAGELWTSDGPPGAGGTESSRRGRCLCWVLVPLLTLTSCVSIPAQDCCGGGHAGIDPAEIEWSVGNEYVLFGVYNSYPRMDLYLASRETLTFQKVDDRTYGFHWSPRDLKFVFLSENFPAPEAACMYPVIGECDRDSGRWSILRKVRAPCGDATWLADGKHLFTWEHLVDIGTGEIRAIREPIPKDARHRPLVMVAADGSGRLEDDARFDRVHWFPADGSAPVDILANLSLLDVFNNTRFFWSPDSQVYVEYDGTHAVVIDIANRQSAVYDAGRAGRGSKYPVFYPGYWDPQSRRFLALPTGPISDLADERKLGWATVGIVERDHLGDWTPIAYLANPGVQEDTHAAVYGVSFTPWSADGKRFVIAHSPVDEHDVPTGPKGKYEWVEWDGKAFNPVAVPEGHIAGFAAGSNEHLFLPQTCWIFHHRLPERRK